MNEVDPKGGGFLRGMVMTIGLLIMTASGLCSAGFLANMTISLIEEGSDQPLIDFGTTLAMIAMWGGVPFLAGWGIWRAGRRRPDDGV